eukprot:jgi/Tetstr1/422913/TSEL_013694.t1
MDTAIEGGSPAGSLGPSEAARGSRIQRLCEHVVNRIAAGEVVQRPASAVKEMLENSIDAGATQVVITAKDGGLKVLQIQDNGHGVQTEDLPLLCERHATSKLREYDDLQSINTLGFRGEALASISYVSHVTVTTMRPGQEHGLRVTYKDSVMDAAGPKPCAAVPGTTICAEHLFYNVPMRRKVLKSPTEEYNRILDIVSRYAVFQTGVGLTCKRQGEARPDVHTLATNSRRDNIRAVYGATVAKELVELNMDVKPMEGSPVEFTIEGFISGANYTGKKTVFVLFINSRCVECSPLKRMLEAVYSSVLPKTCKPFVFMDVRMPCRDVDVNLHPTKKEVGFVQQEELVELVRSAVEGALLASNNSRSFTQQTLSQHVGLPAFGGGAEEDGGDTNAAPPLKTDGTRRDAAGGDHKLVRTDAKLRSLESFLHNRPGVMVPPAAATAATAAAAAAGHAVTRKRARAARADAAGVRRAPEAGGGRAGKLRPLRTASELTSVQELLDEAAGECHDGLAELVGNHTFVGMATPTLGLLQHQTGLYLVDAGALSADLLYQQALARFERFGRVVLQPPPCLRTLLLQALDAEEARGRWQESDGSKAELAGLTTELLKEKADMLAEYFRMEVDGEGRLRSLPQLLEGLPPDLARLPHFLLRLGRDVDWETEKGCFRTMAEALADFYSIKGPLGGEAPPAGEPAGGGDAAEGGGGGARGAAWREWALQHVVFPAMKAQLRPPKRRATDGSVVEVARLEKLYRIFERC